MSILLVSLFGTMRLNQQSSDELSQIVYKPMSTHLREDSVYLGNFTVLTVVPFYENTVVMWSGDTLEASFGREWQSPKYLVPIGRKDSTGARFVTVKNEREELKVSLYVIPLKFPWTPKAEKIIDKPKTYVQDSIRMAKIIDSIYSFVPIEKVLWTEPFVFPVSQAVPRFSAPYGIIRERYPDQTYRDHAGLDIAAKTQGVSGDTLFPMNRGVVAHIGDYEVFGKTIVIDHGGHITILDCHLEKTLVNVGDTVEIGQPIAIMGKSGNATNYSVHITTRVNNVAINPLFLIMWSERLQTEKRIENKKIHPFYRNDNRDISPRGPTGYRGFLFDKNSVSCKVKKILQNDTLSSFNTKDIIVAVEYVPPSEYYLSVTCDK